MVNRILLKCLRKPYPCDEPTKHELVTLLAKNDFEIIDIVMDDGCIWLPDMIDKKIGTRIYSLVEFFFRVFEENPFSNIMLFVVRKR